MTFEEFFSRLAKPAKRALESEGIDRAEKLASLTKKELLSIHGFGPKSLPLVIEYLGSAGMKLRD